MLYRKYLKMHLKSSFQYRKNMAFVALNQILILVGEVLAVYLLFTQFETVAGWTFYESLLMMGVVYVTTTSRNALREAMTNFQNSFSRENLTDCSLGRLESTTKFLAQEWNLSNLPEFL